MENQKNPNVLINAQYIKDLSLESPNAPKSLISIKESPNIQLALDIGIQELEEETYEVSLEINAEAKNAEGKIFTVELVYAGLFTLENIPEEQRGLILAIHCPSILFPFARRIISDVTQDAGFQPLMIDPIDFGALYQKRMLEQQNSEVSQEELN